MFYQIVLICLFITVAQPQMAGHFTRCLTSEINKKNCLIKLLNTVRPLLKDGIKELGIPSYDPLMFPYANIKHKSPEIQFSAHVRNLSFHNLINFELIDLNLDSKGKRVVEEINFPDVLITTDYSIDGVFLNRLLKGDGFAQITTPHMYVINTITYRTFLKNGVKRCEVIGVNIKVTLGNVHVHADGLTKESVSNKFLNDHSQLVTKELSQVIGKIFEVEGRRRYEEACRTNQPGLTDLIFV
ncbi:hypothetical protein FQR65_LT08329 [Abscondita terminalis]|nr:hypothetical protein FQR65_LT08329 [Abscondita terminalis]